MTSSAKAQPLPMRNQNLILRGTILALAMILGAAPHYGQVDTPAGNAGGAGGTSAPQSEPAPAMKAPSAKPFPVSTADVDAGSSVYFDLDTGRIVEPLPFDVQFYLRIPVIEKTTSLVGRYVGDTKPFLCEDAFPRAHIYTDYGFGPREPAPSERRQEQPIGLARFFSDPDSKIKGKEGTSHAEVNVVNGLLPNRYYCFEFLQTRRPTINRKKLAEHLDSVLRTFDPEINLETLPEGTSREIRSAMISAIESELKPGERLVLPLGSFLDQTLEVRDLPAASKRGFHDVLQAQEARDTAIHNLKLNAWETENNAASPFVLLTRLALSDDLKGITSKAASKETRMEEVPTLARALSGSEKVTFWTQLRCGPEAAPQLCPGGIKVLEDIAVGTTEARVAIESPPDSETTPIPLEEAWEPDDLKARRENIDLTISQLRKLRALIVDLQEEGLEAEVGIDDGLAGLKSIVAAAINELDFLKIDFDAVEDALKERSKSTEALVTDLEKDEVIRILVEGTTLASFETRANWYTGMDLGFAWSPDIEDIYTYVGANFYFRPVNKKAHLRWSDFRWRQLKSELAKRLSVTLGITVRDLMKDGQFQGVELQDEIGLIANKPLVVSTGFRLSDFVRISAGALVFKDKNPDPLVNESKLAWLPLVSLSIDYDVWGSMRDRFNRQSGR